MANQKYYGGNKNQNKGNGKPQSIMKKDFFNPYMFVPVPQVLYFLNDSEKKELKSIQDVPVKGGMSGKITIQYEAQTPFCVRDGGESFVNMDGKYFVPGSSLKGMFRSVFEIMSLSNIRNSIENNRYSLRDLYSPAYELKANETPQRSGFLIQINGNFYVQECDSDKYSYDEIEKIEGIKGLKSKKSVADKYALLQRRIVDCEDDSKAMWFFSGFMNNKKHEYLFYIPEFSSQQCHLLQGDSYDDFIFIHEKETENVSWKFWKKQMKNYHSFEDIKNDNYTGIVPCFFRVNEDNSVKDLGFAFLYRQPYSKTIHDFLPDICQNDDIDLAQAVFGYVSKNDSLKGRVQFGNAFIEKPNFIDSQTFILGSPKPTYYPFYLEQNQKGSLKTYSDDNAHINGYKRYLLHKEEQKGTEHPSKVTATFIPMAKGTTFTSIIYYHNLHDYELGALLAAISFYGNTDCFHTIGFAKPFGYGKLKIIKCSIDNVDVKKMQHAFVQKLCDRCHITEQNWESMMRPLFAIAHGNYEPEKEIRYPKLNDKEFSVIKKNKWNIRDFSPN